MKIGRNQLFAAAVILALAVVGMCSYALVKRVGVKQKSWHAAVAAHHAAVDHCKALGREVNSRVKASWRTGMRIAEFEDHFGRVIPIDQGVHPEANSDDTHVFTHEQSHRVFYLRFEKGVLAGYHSSHGADDIQPHLPSIEKRQAQMR